MDTRILLASASPRRQELLAQIGVSFEVCPADIEELPMGNEAPADYVMRVAMDKARVAERIAGTKLPIVAAGTEVVLDGQIFGKPKDYEGFAEMMRRLSGREHRVLSAVVVRWNNQSFSALNESRVTFATLTERNIAQYWQTGEPLGKAGGYAIQGYGALFIVHLGGSYSAVMGLPIHETANLLAQAGFPVLQ